jgi:hypothetical protein
MPPSGQPAFPARAAARLSPSPSLPHSRPASQTGPAPSTIRVLPLSSSVVHYFSLREAGWDRATWGIELARGARVARSLRCLHGVRPFSAISLGGSGSSVKKGRGRSRTGAAEECRLRDGAISPPRPGAVQRGEEGQFTEILSGRVWDRDRETAALTLGSASRSRP